ncbi:MFS transporter [Granulicella tundricola]|uniref:Major facilitator superfamily MFS_1 n=1 Tax=Granulicella tundricola (strain ATCC BAA-1859 / DSM 23138 / MP5ACTX9) TaxID=1198114 RepID=E8X754_GRATM|nr:MFS transporter [Granulicella tundricola]ADW71288.1 major facilitator superfamily MFS_1 [Granulicella tundricola MP5ACTX9]
MTDTMNKARLSEDREIETDLPQRMDRLPWSSWHVRIITALGTSWLLDGLEVTLVGSLSGILESKQGLSLSDPQVTAAATTYLAGAVIGALLFGHLTDRLGRKKLFLVTLATYSVATVCTAFSHGFLFFAVCRFFTGLGIGGEYAAINSAVDELIPGKVRGTVDLFVNGTFWVGASVGSVTALVLLGGSLFPQATSWRYAFGIGGGLGLLVLLLRLAVPESPRWLMLRGREEEAETIVRDVEQRVTTSSGKALTRPEGEKLKITFRDHTPWKEIFVNMLGENRQRSFLGLALMIAQSFFFNAVFFTYALVGKRFFHVPDQKLPLQLLPFAIASFLGPFVLGPLFDRIGRKPMITATYAVAGILLGAICLPFATGSLGLRGLGICFSIIFFVASSAASAAYLTVSEIFPLEIRAFAIALFYAIGTCIGGVGAPLLFGVLIHTGSKPAVAAGYALGAALMVGAAVLEAIIGVEAAGKSLESVSKPLQSK